MTAFVSPFWDAEFFAVSRDGEACRRLIEKQTKLTQCLPFSALIWDTAVSADLETRIGYVIGADVDDQRIWGGAVIPQFRFYSAYDPFAFTSAGVYGNNKPVRLVNGWRNIDPAPKLNDVLLGTLTNYPYQGNLRFRHGRNSTCNVGFADGHVDNFTGKFRSDGKPITHDALRKCFMVKWPSGIGIGPDQDLPH